MTNDLCIVPLMHAAMMVGGSTSQPCWERSGWRLCICLISRVGAYVGESIVTPIEFEYFYFVDLGLVRRVVWHWLKHRDYIPYIVSCVWDIGIWVGSTCMGVTTRVWCC